MTEDAPAYDRTAELSTLAACLYSRTARDEARRHISGADLLQPAHEAVWDAITHLDAQGQGVDHASVLSVLQERKNRIGAELVPTLLTYPALPDHVDTYARKVRAWAIKRRLAEEAIRVRQTALDPEADAASLTATAATRFARLRDSGVAEDAQSVTLGELLAEADDEPDWLIPGLIERRDRLLLTGEEGLGKSHLLRQMGVMAAAGLDPFDPGRHLEPIRVTIIDCENSRDQVRRKIRPVVGFAARYGSADPNTVNLLCSPRIDITRDKDLARIHYELDAAQPDLVVIGPLYRLLPRALQTDDEAAPLLAALDTIRDRGIALMIEAHAGHAIGKGGQRDLRPRGSSALLGWPEFGYGMRTVASGYADLVPWRGDRDAREWPGRIRHSGDRIRWVPVEATPIEEEWA